MLTLKFVSLSSRFLNWFTVFADFVLSDSVYINDLEDGVASNILKFADDTTIFRRVQTRQECRTLQDDLNRLDQWSAKWQMLFN